MLVIQIPYNLIEKIFGTYIADNFNIIMVILLIAGILTKITIDKVNCKNKDWLKEAQERQNKRYEYSDPAKRQPTKAEKLRNKLSIEEKELAKQIHIDHSQPTFEEWKANNEQDQNQYNNQ